MKQQRTITTIEKIDVVAFDKCKSLEKLVILGKETYISNDICYGITTTVYGKEGSLAEKYAQKYGHNFVAE